MSGLRTEEIDTRIADAIAGAGGGLPSTRVDIDVGAGPGFNVIPANGTRYHLNNMRNVGLSAACNFNLPDWNLVAAGYAFEVSTNHTEFPTTDGVPTAFVRLFGGGDGFRFQGKVSSDFAPALTAVPITAMGMHLRFLYLGSGLWDAQDLTGIVGDSAKQDVFAVITHAELVAMGLMTHAGDNAERVLQGVAGFVIPGVVPFTDSDCYPRRGIAISGGIYEGIWYLIEPNPWRLQRRADQIQPPGISGFLTPVTLSPTLNNGSAKGRYRRRWSTDQGGTGLQPDFAALANSTVGYATTGTVDDFAPADWSSVRGAQFAGGADLTVTGFAAVPFGGGEQTKFLINIGTARVVLKHESGSSVAGNRIRCPEAKDITVPPDGWVMIWYDQTASRWRAVRFAHGEDSRTSTSALIPGVAGDTYDVLGDTDQHILTTFSGLKRLRGILTAFEPVCTRRTIYNNGDYDMVLINSDPGVGPSDRFLCGYDRAISWGGCAVFESQYVGSSRWRLVSIVTEPMRLGDAPSGSEVSYGSAIIHEKHHPTNIYRLSPTAAGFNIDGIQYTASKTVPRKRFVIVGVNSITFRHNQGAGNKKLIIPGGVDVLAVQNDVLDFEFDVTSDVWRLV